MVFLVGVAAALSLGLGYVLQQRVAATAPLSELLRLGLLFDLMRRPMWWLGIGCMIVGQVLSGLALQLSAVAVVEPLLSTNLLFALGFAALFAGQRMQRDEIAGAILLSAALGVFIAVGDPHSSSTFPSDPVVGARGGDGRRGGGRAGRGREALLARRRVDPARDGCRSAVRPAGRQHARDVARRATGTAWSRCW